MLTRAGKALVSENRRVRKPRACFNKRNDGPMRMIRETLKIVGENGNVSLLLVFFETNSKMIPLNKGKNKI